MSPQADPADLGVLDAAAMLRSRQLSAVELTDACLRRITERNGGDPTFDGAPDAINAWVGIYANAARDHAHAADQRLELDGESAPALCGIPLALKDLYGVAGLPLTASSRVLDGNVAADDCAVWHRLRDQGLVLLGHTHTHEFAAGGTTDQVGNPWALGRVVGGSSGGNAAALAARMTPAALGTDTCGSLRIPSACAGTSTIKPTHGLIPIDGIVPLAPSLDHAGPMARSIADCAALLAAMGRGESQVSPLTPPPPSIGELPMSARPGPRPLEGVTVALTDRTNAETMDKAVESALDAARLACVGLGARLLSTGRALDARLGRPQHRAADRGVGLSRPARLPAPPLPPCDRRVRRGIHALYRRAGLPGAQARRAHGTAAWEQWLREHGVDLVLEPTLPIVPYERGPGYDRGHAGGAGDPMIALTAMWDMTGMPVASLPVSWDVGISLIAARGCEEPLIAGRDRSAGACARRSCVDAVAVAHDLSDDREVQRLRPTAARARRVVPIIR